MCLDLVEWQFTTEKNPAAASRKFVSNVSIRYEAR